MVLKKKLVPDMVPTKLKIATRIKISTIATRATWRDTMLFVPLVPLSVIPLMKLHFSDGLRAGVTVLLQPMNVTGQRAKDFPKKKRSRR